MTPFHYIGDFVRSLMISIPMPVARGLFALFFIGLIIWVIRLPRERWAPSKEGKITLSANLKLWALVALGIQLAIYMIF